MTKKDTLKDLLRQNYDALTNPECKDAVLEYMSNNETVLDRDIIFIKRLTKVAQHIYKSDPKSLENMLERLYQYNYDGIQKIQTGDINNRYNKNNLLNIKSHLHAYAGDTAEAIFEVTQDLKWAKRFYDDYKLSADLSKHLDKKHSAHAYSFAGDAAKIMFEKTEDVKWVNKAIECYKTFQDYYTQNPNPKMNNLIKKIKENESYLQLVLTLY